VRFPPFLAGARRLAARPALSQLGVPVIMQALATSAALWFAAASDCGASLRLGCLFGALLRERRVTPRFADGRRSHNFGARRRRCGARCAGARPARGAARRGGARGRRAAAFVLLDDSGTMRVLARGSAMRKIGAACALIAAFAEAARESGVRSLHGFETITGAVPFAGLSLRPPLALS
jgi:hypothetical protein